MTKDQVVVFTNMFSGQALHAEPAGGVRLVLNPARGLRLTFHPAPTVLVALGGQISSNHRYADSHPRTKDGSDLSGSRSRTKVLLV